MRIKEMYLQLFVSLCTEDIDLTRVVISYEMTTRVRFCLLHDLLKWDFIAFKMNII